MSGPDALSCEVLIFAHARPTHDNGLMVSPSGVLAGGQGDRQRVRKECRTDTPSVFQECLQVVKEIDNGLARNAERTQRVSFRSACRWSRR